VNARGFYQLLCSLALRTLFVFTPQLSYLISKSMLVS